VYDFPVAIETIFTKIAIQLVSCMVRYSPHCASLNLRNQVAIDPHHQRDGTSEDESGYSVHELWLVSV